MRQAAATARQVLLGMASAKLGVPVASLSVTTVLCRAAADGEVRRPARRQALQHDDRRSADELERRRLRTPARRRR